MPEFHRERQTFHWIFRLLLLATFILPWAIIAATLMHVGPAVSAGGKDPLKDIWVVAAFELPLFALIWLLMGGMTVRVSPERVAVAYGSVGWPRWTFKREDIEAFEPVSFSPIRDFGGWGIKWGKGNVMCINASGSRGVQFTIKGKQRKYLIGSDDPEALVAAIRSAMALNPAPSVPSA